MAPLAEAPRARKPLPNVPDGVPKCSYKNGRNANKLDVCIVDLEYSGRYAM